MTRSRALLLASALAVVPALAQAATPPVPSVPVDRYRLPNGLTVLLSEDHRLPIVATEVHYRVGSAHEAPGRSGFAHLFEHLMFQGSEHYDNEYFKPFEPIGGVVNGTTNTDRTNFYEQVPSNALELSLWMQADRMKGLLPVMTQGKLDNQRDVVKNERRQRYENTPYGEVWRLIQENLYPVGHPYQHTTIGSHEDLTAASLDDVKGFFRQYYVPANTILTIAGDFEPAATKALIERYFGDIPGGQAAPRPNAAPPMMTQAKHVVEADQVKLGRVHLAWHSPAFFAEGDAALDVWSTILTDGKTSRLYKPLVYEQKVAKDVSAFQASNLLGSYFVVQATVAPGKTLGDLEKALMAALTQAAATPPTDDEMLRALSGWRKSFYARVESVLSRAQMLSTYEHFVGDANYLAKDLARYTELTPAAIHESVRRHLSLAEPEHYLRVDIVPEPTAAPDKPPAAKGKGKKPAGGAKGGAK